MEDYAKFNIEVIQLLKEVKGSYEISVKSLEEDVLHLKNLHHGYSTLCNSLSRAQKDQIQQIQQVLESAKGKTLHEAYQLLKDLKVCFRKPDSSLMASMRKIKRQQLVETQQVFKDYLAIENHKVGEVTNILSDFQLGNRQLPEVSKISMRMVPNSLAELSSYTTKRLMLQSRMDAAGSTLSSIKPCLHAASAKSSNNPSSASIDHLPSSSISLHPTGLPISPIEAPGSEGPYRAPKFSSLELKSNPIQYAKVMITKACHPEVIDQIKDEDSPCYQQMQQKDFEREFRGTTYSKSVFNSKSPIKDRPICIPHPLMNGGALTLIPAFFVECTSSDAIYFRTPKMATEFVQLQRDLKTYFETQFIDLFDAPINPVGFIGALRFGDRWFRVKVINVENYPRIGVFLVDIALSLNVNAAEIHHLPDVLKTKPKTLFCVSFSGDADRDSKATKHITDQLEGAAEIYIGYPKEAESSLTGNTLPVAVYIYEKRNPNLVPGAIFDDANMNEELISLGLASFIS